MNFAVKPVAAVKLNSVHQPLFPPANHHRPLFSKPLSSLSFRTTTSPPPRIRICSSSSSSSPPPFRPSASLNNDSPIPKQNPSPIPPFIKSAVIATAAAAAIFFSRLYFFTAKPAIASSAGAAATVETAQNDAVEEEGREKALEEHLLSRPDDVEALRNLMEIRIKSRKMLEAIEIVDRLIELEPEEVEWPLMKCHLYIYSGDVGAAKKGFTEIISKDPFRVEAYHGLVMAESQDEDNAKLQPIEDKIKEAMKLCKKENKTTDLRDFKLLLAQIRVIEGGYNEALKLYQELVKEEPRDFRPYLCEGIIYTMLKRNDEAEKSFEKYRRLVPKGHPYARYFEDNMIATKVFAQKVENERSGIKS